MSDNLKIREIAESFVRQIEAGTPPWLRPWRNGVPGGSADMPRNLVSGRPYSGFNVPVLWSAAADRGFADQSWMTYRQALERGGHVRKGEKSTTVYFLKRGLTTKPKAGEGDTEGDGTARPFFMLRSYHLFNIAQCEGVEPVERASPAARPEPERIAHAEHVLSASRARIEYGGDRAVYSPTFDVIRLPVRGAFKSAQGFYSTALHELTHWTGHPTRCNRDFKNRFGSEAYAFEELVAEIGSAFLCAHTGIVAELQHAAYLANWCKVLREWPRAIFTAAARAWDAYEHVAKLAGESTGADRSRDDEAPAAPLPVAA